MFEVYFEIDGEVADEPCYYATLVEAYEDTARIHRAAIEQFGPGVDVRAVIRPMPACRGNCGKLLTHKEQGYCTACATVKAAIAAPDLSTGWPQQCMGAADCVCPRCTWDEGEMDKTKTV